jgi:hypothetical protein
MKIISSETLHLIYNTVMRHIPGHHDLNIYSRESLKPQFNSTAGWQRIAENLMDEFVLLVISNAM